MRIIMKWAVSLLLTQSCFFLSKPVLATEICMDCRPLELQRAPGLGIDLAIGYGTAAIKYRNGTIVDVVKILGTESYIQAMKTLASDAMLVRVGQKSSLPKLKRIPSIQRLTISSVFLNPTPSRIYAYLKQLTQPHHLPLPPSELDSIVSAIAEMLFSLKHTVATTHGILYPDIILSLPDFEVDRINTHESRFERAVLRAGLQQLHSPTPASRSALAFYSIGACDLGENSEDDSCSEVEGDGIVGVVLVFFYSEESLGVTLLTRWLEGPLWGTLWPRRVSEELGLGSRSVRRDEKYWDAVRDIIDAIVEAGETVDRIIFLGSDAGDKKLRDVARDTMKRHTPEGDLKILGVDADVDGGSEEAVFAAVRGAAMVARRGMVDRFDACIVPDRCKREDGELEKSEL